VRDARRDAEAPVLEQLLDQTRVIQLAQRLSREQLHEHEPDALESVETAEAR
jgi:hypothetical protein